MPDKPDTFFDWSSTFVRLRAEVFSSALLLFVITFAQANLTHIPFIGVTIDPPLPNKGWIQLALLVFFVYTAFALVIRASAELSHAARPHAPLQQTLDALEAFADKLRKTSIEERRLSVEEVQKAIKEFIDNYAVVAKDEDLLQLGKLSASTEYLIKQVETYEERLRVAQLGGDRGVEEATKNALAGYRDTVERSETTLADLQNGYRAAMQSFTDFKVRLDLSLKGLEEIRRRPFTEFEAQLSEALRAVQELRSALRRMRNIEGTDRNLFGLWAPLLASCVLVILVLLRVLGRV